MPGTVFGSIQAASNFASTGNNVANTTAANLGVGPGTNAFWIDSLRPASFRTVPFGVFGGQIHFGRNNAVHSYPFRDSVWVEDMGKSARRITMEGFLVGDDVIAQRDRMMKACETPGEGALVHPTLGQILVSLLEAESEEQWDHGRVFKLRFVFIQSGKRIFPSNSASTGSAVADAATNANAAAASDFKSRAAGPFRLVGGAAVQAAVNTAALWARNAQRLVNDATNMKHLVQDAGNLLSAAGGNQTYGRRFSGGPVPASKGYTQQQLVGAGSVARTGVATSAAQLNADAAAVSATTTDPFCASAQALVASINAAAQDPADGLRLLASLADFALAMPPASDAIGVGLNTVTDSCGDLFRRAAVTGMALAASAYQPVSYDDAAYVRSWVRDLLDAEIQIAGDQAEDDAFSALFDLRTAVMQDLTARGASLASLVEVTTNVPLPAIVLAYRLYGDITRTDELIEFVDPVNPLFMPTAMRVLSK